MASDPSQNVWVQANAGTGKTSVLVQRLLRILFRSGNDGILCLTYTNAGASEMRNRILKELRGWAVSDDADLRRALRGISHNKTPTDADVATARAIFYEYIDNPAALKIRTIHGFCEEILRRFPIEAGVPPSWKLISGADQKRLLRDTFQQMANNTADADAADAFERILDQLSEHSLDDLLSILTGQYRRFFGATNREQFIDTTKEFLKIDDAAKIAFFDEKNIKNRLSIIDSIAAESKPAGYLLKISEQIRKYFSTSDFRLSTFDFEEYKSAFLTADGGYIKLVAKKDYLAREQNLVYELDQENINREIFENSVALFDLTDAFAAKYRETKAARGLLDFDDLILYTNELFSNPSMMGWILSQLDNNIQHILVDEAQDTSPEQWDILRGMTTNFFTDGDGGNPRSLFVVGDTKQSIFSFQGADPEIFAESKTSIGDQIRNDMRRIAEIPLAQSYRSTAPILSAVDYFFNDISIGSLAKFENNNHKVFRIGDKGRVELHPLLEPAESERNKSTASAVARRAQMLASQGCGGPHDKISPLRRTAENQDTANARHQYVLEIAGKIEYLVRDRKVQPADIMILVQRRNPFAPLLIDELQRRNIPVAGSDRIKLPDFPAVRDLLNLARWTQDADDDYMLACVLKSPLFRLNESDLFKLCHNRDDNLYTKVKELHPDVYKRLDVIKSLAALPPYSFFMRILGMDGNRARMIGALGAQIIDPLEEFLTIALSYERTQPGDIKKFIKWFVDGGSEIVREVDKNAGIRVVTTHGAKGLEANIVILCDTVKSPRSKAALRITEPVPCGNAFLWKGRLDKSAQYMQAESEKYEKSLSEYYRLLYVAMTRARDELYIFGFKGARDNAEHSWHDNLSKILPNHPDAKVKENGIIVIEN